MVCWATGGPQKYTGRSMKDSHQQLMITATEWEAMVMLADRSFEFRTLPCFDVVGKKYFDFFSAWMIGELDNPMRSSPDRVERFFCDAAPTRVDHHPAFGHIADLVESGLIRRMPRIKFFKQDCCRHQSTFAP
jgi:hypothetical protein